MSRAKPKTTDRRWNRGPLRETERDIRFKTMPKKSSLLHMERGVPDIWQMTGASSLDFFLFFFASPTACMFVESDLGRMMLR